MKVIFFIIVLEKYHPSTELRKCNSAHKRNTKTNKNRVYNNRSSKKLLHIYNMCALRVTKGRDKKIKSGPTSRAKAAQQHIHLSFSRKENANFYTPLPIFFFSFFFFQQKKRKSSTNFNSTLLI